MPSRSCVAPASWPAVVRASRPALPPIEHVSLAADPAFQDEFASCMSFRSLCSAGLLAGCSAGLPARAPAHRAREPRRRPRFSGRVRRVHVLPEACVALASWPAVVSGLPARAPAPCTHPASPVIFYLCFVKENRNAPMPHPVIKFGTDGWRGVIADDFTFANVRTAAEAIAAYVQPQRIAQEDPAKGLCIGYDTRFGSKAFARACAEVVAATGIPVQLANAVTPTPALSFGVRERGAAGGIMITSSHNPAQWNGVKYKGWYGGSGKPSMIAAIESYLGKPVAARLAARAHHRSRLPAHLPQSHRELRRSRPHRQIRHEVLHRLHVRRRRHHSLRHLRPHRRRARADSLQSRSALSRHQSRAHRAATSAPSAKPRSPTTARPASAPTATPTASARPTSTATSSIRTKSTPSCSVGC